jgi:hypothetical protein
VGAKKKHGWESRGSKRRKTHFRGCGTRKRKHIAETKPIRSNQVDTLQVVTQNDARDAVANEGEGGESGTVGNRNERKRKGDSLCKIRVNIPSTE